MTDRAVWVALLVALGSGCGDSAAAPGDAGSLADAPADSAPRDGSFDGAPADAGPAADGSAADGTVGDGAVGRCEPLVVEAARGVEGVCDARECEGVLGLVYGEARWTERGVERAQVIDLYLPAERSGPVPFVVYAHSNARTHALDRADAIVRDVASPLLAAGAAFASVEFRHPFVNRDIGAPATDLARALQFLRCHADSLGLAPERAAGFGSSRGTLLLWTALQDDLADPDSPDPVARQSTRLRGVFGVQAQTSYWGQWIAETFFAPEDRAAFLASFPADDYGHAVGDVSPDDPPVALSYRDPVVELPLRLAQCGAEVDCLHLPNFGDELCKAYAAAGIGERCVLTAPAPDGRLYEGAASQLLGWLGL